MFSKNKNKIYILITIVIVIFFGFWFFRASAPVSDLSKIRIIQIGNAVIQAEFVTAQEDQIKGLSGRTFLAENAGMFFVFEYPMYWGIWMKDMNFPIDVLWITDDMKVSDIVENMLPSSYPNTYKPHIPVRYVLEIPSGMAKKYGITVGQKVVLK
jgi:hypothetical protein